MRIKKNPVVNDIIMQTLPPFTFAKLVRKTVFLANYGTNGPKTKKE
ncbi:hypothetical protein SOASR030_08780 [Leminorella grimontii]|uniref:Uncharacterized protein n=1 Tax=Leminorella grimontii TaxID=82981 RepID=A0AAV5N1Y9_9GAMM|nr:hypothetical protein SOASR030_08780 [Leminorella grimontii]